MNPATSLSPITPGHPGFGERKLIFATHYGRSGLVGILTLRAPVAATDAAVHECFKEAVRTWVAEDPLGKVTWNTCAEEGAGELHVGDLSLTGGFRDAALLARLDAVDLGFVAFDLAQDVGDRRGHFDALLVDTTPEAT